MPFLFTCFIFQTDISLLILRLDQSVGIPLTLVNYIHLISLCIAEYEEIMSKKFHLDTCIFWIHRLDIEFLGTNDLNLFVLFIILVQICFLEVGSLLLLIYDLVLVFPELTFNYFLYKVD